MKNHDGLPQKAGFPQEKINEIHGAWYDPSNPVVQFSGSLRGDLFNWMLEIEEETDLCLCLGTSLSGMNADRCAWTPAKKYCKKKKGNGTIMINLQRTKIDESSSIRVWAKLDDAFQILVKKLDLDMNKLRSPPKYKEDIFYIPYDEEGKPLSKDSDKLMKLDFSLGKKVKIAHPKSSFHGVVGEIYRKYDDHYSFMIFNEKKNKSACYALGTWWLDSGIKGTIDRFPYVNVDPIFVDKKSLKIEEKFESKKPLEKKIVEKKPKTKKLIVGNTHQQKDKEVHIWKCFVKPEEEGSIESVHFHLHPTFTQKDILITESPFEIERSGWGTFKINIDIKFSDGKEHSISHDLSFEGNGSQKSLDFK